MKWPRPSHPDIVCTLYLDLPEARRAGVSGHQCFLMPPGVCLDPADDVHQLLPGHAVHHWVGVGADWNICTELIRFQVAFYPSCKKSPSKKDGRREEKSNLKLLKDLFLTAPAKYDSFRLQHLHFTSSFMSSLRPLPTWLADSHM